MKVTVLFTPEFVKTFKNLEHDLQNEIIEKINLFSETDNHPRLKVHKLHGRLKGRSSFSVNYKYRIVFKYVNKTPVLLTVGNHDIYK